MPTPHSCSCRLPNEWVKFLKCVHRWKRRKASTSLLESSLEKEKSKSFISADMANSIPKKITQYRQSLYPGVHPLPLLTSICRDKTIPTITRHLTVITYSHQVKSKLKSLYPWKHAFKVTFSVWLNPRQFPIEFVLPVTTKKTVLNWLVCLSPWRTEMVSSRAGSTYHLALSKRTSYILSTWWTVK